MKLIKMTAVIGILALGLMTAPALANSVLNGDFQNTISLQYWTQVSDGSIHQDFGSSNDNINYFAAASEGGPTHKEASMYQIVDVSKLSDGTNNTNWFSNGISESYDFKFSYRRTSATNSTTPSTAAYGIFYSTATTMPTFGGLDTPGNGWSIIKADTSLTATSGTTWGNVEEKSTTDLLGQPQWFVIAFEGHKGGSGGTYRAQFDNVTLATVGTPPSTVPIPGSVLLLGSGLVGVALLRFRRREKKA